MSYLTRKTHLQNLVNSLFHRTVTTALDIDPHRKPFYDKIRSINKVFEPPQNHYVGEYMCGLMSWTLYTTINSQQLPISNLEMRKVSYGYGRYEEDHVYISAKINGERIIIDPTWRQFFINPMKNDTDYPYYLYLRYQPFFVGDQNDLEQMVNDLYRVDKLDNVGTLPRKDESLQWWAEGEQFLYNKD